jgi:hypothetical protein
MVAKTFPLLEAGNALKLLAAGGVEGKTVLEGGECRSQLAWFSSWSSWACSTLDCRSRAAHEAGARVIAGHFGFAAMVKSREPQRASGPALVIDAWLPVDGRHLRPALRPRYRAHRPRGSRCRLASSLWPGSHYADYAHSLLGALIIAATFGLVAGWRWGRRNGIVLAAVVFSHWVLDLLVHRADIPILPGNAAPDAEGSEKQHEGKLRVFHPPHACLASRLHASEEGPDLLALPVT